MEKKPYVKPTIARHGMFSHSGGYLGFGKETPRWLYLEETESERV